MSRGDLTETEWRVLKDLLLIEAANCRRGRRPEEDPCDHQRNTLATALRNALARIPPKYGNWNTIYRRFSRVWESVSTTLTEIMADSGHYSIDSTTVRAHVSAAGGKGGTSKSSWPLAGRVHQ